MPVIRKTAFKTNQARNIINKTYDNKIEQYLIKTINDYQLDIRL